VEEYVRIERKLVHKGSIIDFYTDTMKVKNGNIVDWDFLDHKGAAAVVPVLPDGKILMVKQYRNAIERETIEIPAGGLNDRNEPYITCSHRELEEETGYQAKVEEMEFLISLYTTVAFCNERIDVFVANNLEKSVQNLDENEYINVKAYPLEELISLIYQGKIQDAKTIAALLAYKNKYVK